ncbi:MAG: hypothetical protein WC767_01725 [Candidatus Paceibacterota bacterium]|jgi:hypothetical protein
MRLELHDSDPKNSLFARVKGIDYDYQAEQWVLDTRDKPKVVRWVLIDEVGARCIWEREPGDTGIPAITRRSDRFTGTWQRTPGEEALPIPSN